MKIRVNGEDRELEESLSIRGLLDSLGLKEKLVVVEHNKEVVNKEDFEEVTLNEGDEIEIMRYIGGG
jgi:thiamine biosynthesis protein ThiS